MKKLVKLHLPISLLTMMENNEPRFYRTSSEDNFIHQSLTQNNCGFDDLIQPIVSRQQIWDDMGQLIEQNTKLLQKEFKKQLLDEVQVQAVTLLDHYLNQTDDLTGLSQIFGLNIFNSQTDELLNQWQTGNHLPTLEIANLESIEAQGAYSATTQTIYLSDTLFDHPNQTLISTYLEELGHHLDDVINIEDSQGDEGEAFAALILNRSLSIIEQVRISQEDDTITWHYQDQNIIVERSSLARTDEIKLISSLGEVYQLPGLETDTVNVSFKGLDREASYDNEVGVYVVDEQGRVNGIAPNESGYAKAVFNSTNRQILLGTTDEKGDFQDLSFQGGQYIAFYLIQNNSFAEMMQKNSKNEIIEPENNEFFDNTENNPLALFSITAANPDGFDHIYSQDLEGGIWRLSWEDLTKGGDQDFNDTILNLEQMGTLLAGEEGQTVPLSVESLADKSNQNHELGYFLVDNAQGKIGNLLPGDEGYLQAIFKAGNYETVFQRGGERGLKVLNLPSGKYLGWYLITNGSISDWLSENPTNQLNESLPIAYFSYNQANPDGKHHVYQNSPEEMAWEDSINVEDGDYNDFVFRCQLGTPISNPKPKLPQISVTTSNVLEGDEKGNTVEFVVSLSEVSDSTVSVNYQIINGTAIEGEDFEGISGQLTFAPGEIEKRISVNITGDLTVEENETFSLSLDNVVNAIITTGIVEATILNDDEPNDGGDGEINQPPTLTLENQITSLPENTDTSNRQAVADIVVNDDKLGNNQLLLSGVDANSFEIENNKLYLKANTELDFETKDSYQVTVSVDDSTVGNSPDNSVNYTLTITDINEPPAIETITVMPGNRLAIELSDRFGEDSSFSLLSDQPLPTGILEADGTLIFTPTPSELGTYEFTILAQQENTETTGLYKLEVIADPIQTTRISGVIKNTDEIGLEGVIVGVGNVQTTTAADGTFTLEFLGEVTGEDFLRIEPGQQVNNVVYPNISEKIDLLLENELFESFNNMISRPIYLPKIDMENAKTIDPNQNITVSTNAIPNASVFVAAGSLTDPEGNLYTGQMSITEVPRDLTPAALPSNVIPDIVVTIQPGEMRFNTPAPLSLPNNAGYAPGTELDLWSINPTTGQFDNVGTGRVSNDGTVIETISGGIRNSSWHFFAPPPETPENPENDNRNEDDGCDDCKGSVSGTSEVQLHSGAVIENHDLVSYQSLGVDRGLSLVYDSQRADARPILHFGYQNVIANPNRRLMAELTFKNGNFEYQVPGFAGGFGLDGGEHFWKIPNGGGSIDAALQANLRFLESGRYDYELTTGLVQFNNNSFNGSTSTSTGNILHVNGIGGVFGNGWGLAGWQELVENDDGSVLLIDGDGGELLFEAPLMAGEAYQNPAGDFSTLEKLNNGTFRRTMKDQMVYTFNSDNQLASVSDRNGNETRYIYNAQGNLSKIIDPVGLETNFTYTNNKVTKIVDPANRETKLQYDEKGNLTRITDPDGTSRKWDYDTDFHIIQETDKRGNVEKTFYDFAGRADSAIRKDGSTLDFNPVQVQGLYAPTATINPVNAPFALQLSDTPESVYMDANGNEITYRLDQAGQIIDSFDEVGLLPSVERNEDNLVTLSTNARGNVTSFTYDEKGNVLSIQDSLSFGRRFVDISQTGSPVSGINNTDDKSVLVNLPFSFTFYDQSYTEIGISSNGLISFGGTNSTYTNQSLDSNGSGLSGLPSILPFWDDLETRSNEDDIATVFVETRGQVGNQVYIIQWHQLEAYSFDSESGDITFQVILSERTNAIQFNYLDVHFEGETETEHGEGRSATIGIWNSPNEFQQYSFNEASVTNGMSLIVTETGFIEGDGLGNGSRNFSYDSNFNQLTSQIDELGNQTLYQIDPNNGNTLSITQVIGEVGGNDDLITRFTYTNQGLVDLVTDPLEQITDYDYDALGRLIKITFAKGTVDEASQQFEYDTRGNQTAIIDENGNRTEFEYDALNRIIKITEADPDGAGILTSPITTYTYDSAGNLKTTIDSRNNVTAYEYDELNRVITLTDELENVITYGYDSLGNLTSIIDPNNHQTRYIYDDRDRLMQTIDPENGVTKFGYDLDNNLTSVIDAEENETTFSYDARNRLISEIDPLGKTTTYTYDAGDNLVSQSDRNNRVIEYEYDDVYRLTTETWQNSDQVINYSYDKNGNLTSVNDKFSALTFTYDNRNRLISESNIGTPNIPEVVLNYSYDHLGNVISLSDRINGTNQGTNNYSYDALNRLTRLTQTGSNVSNKRIDLTYNPLGQYDTISRYNDLNGNNLVNQSTYTYDSLNRLERLAHNNGSSDIAFYNFEYDPASRINKITDIDGFTNYSYDDRDQLTEANHSDTNNSDETYEYDANGNRINSSIHGENYVTGDGNRLLSDGVYNYEYDAEGNMIKRTDIATGAVQEYQWDYRNRMIAVIDKNSNGNETQKVEFTYDALDRRIAKTVDTTPATTGDGVVTYFVYDGENVHLEFTDNDGVNGANQPQLSQRYLHGAGVDQIMAQEDKNGNVTWALSDHLGTIRDLVDNNGDLVNHLIYDSFGQVIAESDANIDTRYLFTGREFDEETGLYYYRARYYDAIIGRFISEDPIGFDGGDTNVHRYVKNNPTHSVDPDGKEAITFGGVLVAGGTAAAVDGPLPIGDIIGVGIVIVGGIIVLASREKGENEITRGVRDEAQRTGQDPCDILQAMLDSCTDNATKRKIQQAQKFMGCRNKSKRKEK